MTTQYSPLGAFHTPASITAVRPEIKVIGVQTNDSNAMIQSRTAQGFAALNLVDDDLAEKPCATWLVAEAN